MANRYLQVKDSGGLARRIFGFLFPGSAPAAASGSEVVIPVHQIYDGEYHIGEVGGRIATVDLTPTITAGAYDAGDNVGGRLTFADVVRVDPGSGEIIGAVLIDKAAQGAAVELILFDANPSGGTITNNAAPVIAAADAGKIIGSIPFVDYVEAGGQRFSQARVSIPFSPASGQDLYGVLILRGPAGPPTYAAVSDLIIRLLVRQN